MDTQAKQELLAEWADAAFNAQENWTVSPHEHIERLTRAGDALVAALSRDEARPDDGALWARLSPPPEDGSVWARVAPPFVAQMRGEGIPAARLRLVGDGADAQIEVTSRDEAAPASGSPLPLEHWRSCPALSDGDCTCGLTWRVRLVTEQEQHAAWRQRAEEAEAAQASLVALHRRLHDAAMREKRAQAEMVVRPDIEEKALAHDEAEMDRIAAYLDLLAWTPAAPSAPPEAETRCVAGGHWLKSPEPICDCGAVSIATLDGPEVETLRAERDEARAIVARINNEVFGSEGYFTTPDAVEAVGRLKVGANAARAALAEKEALLASLSVGTCPECGPVYRYDEDGCCVGCGHDVAFDSVERRAVLAGSAPTGEKGDARG